MVTTRSADKRITSKGQKEDLALRSKPSDMSISLEQPTQPSPTPDASSTHKHIKIKIDIPLPPVDSQRSDNESNTVIGDNILDSPYMTARESPGSARQADALFESAAQAFESTGITSRIEIPDSELSDTTPTKSTFSKNRNTVSLEDEKVNSISISTPAKGTKRKSAVSSQGKGRPSRSSTTPSSAKREHKRFEADETDSTLNGIDSKDEELGIAPDSKDEIADSDEDAAPEVISAKITPSRGRSTRASKRAQSKAAITLSQNREPPQSQPMKPDESAAEDETLTSDSPPTAVKLATIDLPVSTPSKPESSPLPSTKHESNNEINDTNETEPSSTQAQTPTPTPALSLALTSHSRSSPQTLTSTSSPTTLPIRPHKTSTLIPHSRPRPQILPPPPTLPPKSSNTFELHRQLLLSRASKKRGSKLQDEWAGKRRRFVVA